MQRLPIEEKVARGAAVSSSGPGALQRPAAAATERASCEGRARSLAAAGDRIKTAGDILEYADFFLADDQLAYDEKALAKSLRQARTRPRCWHRFRDRLAAAEAFDAASLEAPMQEFVAEQRIKIGEIIHPSAWP